MQAEFKNPMMTPDGKLLFTQGLGCICKFKVADGKFKFEEASPAVIKGVVGVGVQVSPDSKWVCLPNGGNYATPIFSVDSLAKPECTLEQGPYPQAVGFDPAAGLVYTHTPEHVLALFTLGGIKKKEYAFDKNAHDARQYLTHPAGNNLLLLQNDKLFFVEVPKQS